MKHADAIMNILRLQFGIDKVLESEQCTVAVHDSIGFVSEQRQHPCKCF